MIRIVEEDGYCPICEREIWKNCNGTWICSCGEVWEEGKYMRSLDRRSLVTMLKILMEELEYE